VPKLCAGVVSDFPEPLLYNFPHQIGTVVPAADFYFDAGLGRIRARGCDMVVWTDDLNCDACFKCQEDNEALSRAEMRADNRDLAASRIPKAYLTDLQRDERNAISYAKYQRMRLALLGRDRKLLTAMRKLDDYSRLVTLVATDKLARVRAFFASQVRRGSSPRYMIDLWRKAMAGLFKPKQYDEEEIDEAILTWRLGIKSLVYAQNHSKSVGGASLATARRRGMLQPFYASVTDVTMKEIRLNFETLLKKDPTEPCLWHLKIDDVKGNKQLRVSETDGICRGACYHAKGNVNLNIKSFGDIEAICTKLDNGTIHYGTELTVAAVAANRENNYEPHVVALSAGCLKGDPPERTRKLLECIMTTYTGDPRGQDTRGILATVQPDGAGLFVKICHAAFFSERMTSSHPLYEFFSDSPLWPMWTGSGIYLRCTAGCELKHTAKRFVERLKSETGMKLVEYTFYGSTLRRMIRSSGVSSASDINEMFATGAFDAMRVPSKIKLLRAVSQISEMSAGDFDDDGRMVFMACRRDLLLLGRFCGVYAEVVADKRPTLSQNMINTSTLQHLSFVLYRKQGTKWLANQTYRNQQAMLRSLQWSVATALKEKYPFYFLYQDSGDDLENVFNILRMICGPGVNLDALTAEQKLAIVAQVLGIMEKHPHLKKLSRHREASVEEGPLDHTNPRTYLSTPDGGRDLSRILLKDVNLMNTFFLGRDRAEKWLLEAGFSAEDVDWIEIAKDPEVDFLRPNGEFVGVRVFDDEEEGVDGGESSKDDDEQQEVENAFATEIVAPEVLPLNERRIEVPLGDGKFKEMSLAAALKFGLDGRGATCETSRIARVRGGTKSGTFEITNVDAVSETESFHASEDPFLLLTSTSSGITFAIVTAEQFCYEGKKMTSITVEQFEAPGTIFTCSIIKPKMGTTSDGEPALIWEHGCALREQLVNVSTSTAMAFNPTVTTEDIAAANKARDIKISYTMGLPELEVMLQIQLDKHRASPDKPTSKKQLAAPKSNVVPYIDATGEFVLIAPGSQPASSPCGTRKESKKKEMVPCVVAGCLQVFSREEMRQHVGWHILAATGSEAADEEMPCGMCTRTSAQYVADDEGSPGCPSWLVNKNRTIKPFTMCKSLGYFDYSHGAASKFSKSSPCTNVLLECPECKKNKKPMGQFFWKYRCMDAHWARMHPTIEKPKDLVEALKLHEKELDGLKTFAKSKSRGGQSRKRAREKA
jgi:hypothetical protein